MTKNHGDFYRVGVRTWYVVDTRQGQAYTELHALDMDIVYHGRLRNTGGGCRVLLNCFWGVNTVELRRSRHRQGPHSAFRVAG